MTDDIPRSGFNVTVYLTTPTTEADTTAIFKALYLIGDPLNDLSKCFAHSETRLELVYIKDGETASRMAEAMVKTLDLLGVSKHTWSIDITPPSYFTTS